MIEQEQENSGEFQKAWNYALRRLASKSYHSTRLSKLMGQNGFPHECIERVLDRCRAQGLIQDQEWVENSIRSQQKRLKGPRMIRQSLRFKGISQEEIDSSFKQEEPVEGEEGERDGGVSQVELIQALLKKKRVDASKIKTDPKLRQRVIALLVRRGFEFEAISEVLS